MYNIIDMIIYRFMSSCILYMRMKEMNQYPLFHSQKCEYTRALEIRNYHIYNIIHILNLGEKNGANMIANTTNKSQTIFAYTCIYLQLSFALGMNVTKQHEKTTTTKTQNCANGCKYINDSFSLVLTLLKWQSHLGSNAR